MIIPSIILLLGVLSANAVKCPETEVITDFDPAQYLGRWYEIQSFVNPFESGNCTQATYGPVNDEGQVLVLNQQISEDGSLQEIEGYAVQQRPGGGDLKVFLNTTGNGYTEGSYDVLGTDYENFSLVHSCVSLLGIKIEFAWILSRTRTLPAESRKTIDELIIKNGLNNATFVDTPQVGCPDIN